MAIRHFSGVQQKSSQWFLLCLLNTRDKRKTFLQYFIHGTKRNWFCCFRLSQFDQRFLIVSYRPRVLRMHNIWILFFPESCQILSLSLAVTKRKKSSFLHPEYEDFHITTDVKTRSRKTSTVVIAFAGKLEPNTLGTQFQAVWGFAQFSLLLQISSKGCKSYNCFKLKDLCVLEILLGLKLIFYDPKPHSIPNIIYYRLQYCTQDVFFLSPRQKKCFC